MNEKLLTVLKMNPVLTVDGYGIVENEIENAGYKPHLSKEEREAIFNEKRIAFMTDNNVQAYNACCDYLHTVRCSKNVSSKNPDSYRLKNAVERWARANGRPLTYVPKGVFIAAALSMADQIGLKIQRFHGGTGARFNIKSAAFA